MQRGIEQILDFFDTVDSFDTKNDKAFNSIEILQKLREDIPLHKENGEDLLNNAKTYRFFVIGPKV